MFSSSLPFPTRTLPLAHKRGNARVNNVNSFVSSCNLYFWYLVLEKETDSSFGGVSKRSSRVSFMSAGSSTRCVNQRGFSVTSRSRCRRAEASGIKKDRMLVMTTHSYLAFCPGVQE